MARLKKLQLVRPYGDEAAFIEAEGWTIRKRSVVLIGAPELEIGTEVRCDVALDSGQKLIRAEGRVVEQVAPVGDRPGGLKLRFQRVAPDTQAFINRVLANATQPVDSMPLASPEPLIPPDAEESATPAAEERTAGESAAATPEDTSAAADADEKPRRSRRPKRKRKASDSGMHARVVPPVDPPPNREELLDRLRARHRSRVEEREGTREDAG